MTRIDRGRGFVRPVIGLTAYHDQEKAQLYLRDNYLRSVLDAGGLPVLLPPSDGFSDAFLSDAGFAAEALG